MSSRFMLLAAGALALTACAGGPRLTGHGRSCASAGNLSFVCGAEKPEDLARIGGSRWLVASGFSPGAGLKLVDTRWRTLRRWFLGTPDQIDPDLATYPDCAAPPSPAEFNARGLSLRMLQRGHGRLLVVNHGGRESIEVFTVDLDGTDSPPRLRWRGCLKMPPGHVGNSVASYADGTVLVTVLTRPGTTITDFVRGERTGLVLQRVPTDDRFRPLPGTELRGNNGLETAPDDSGFYVVAFGSREVVVFARRDQSKPLWRVTAPEFMPDNIHWDGGRLIAAGMVRDEPACGGTRKIVNGVADSMACHRGYVVAELHPAQRSFSLIAYGEPNASFNGVSSAVIVGGELWLGSYQADRLAVRALPGGGPAAAVAGAPHSR